MTCIYFAGPLFTQSEWKWNVALAAALREAGFDVVLPQERAVPMLEGAENFDTDVLFGANIAGINRAAIMLAILDQADPDSGTSWECGYAFSRGIPIVGLRTDLRPAGEEADRPVNLMLARSCKEFINLPFDKREDVKWIVQAVSNAVEKALSA